MIRTQPTSSTKPSGGAAALRAPLASRVARRWRAGTVALIAGGGLLWGPLATHASAATVPTVPNTINVAALESALQSAPGVTAAQAQAVAADLEQLETTGVAPNLGTDLDDVITAIGQATGESPVLDPLLGSVENLANSLLGGTVSTSQVEGLIDQLEGASGTSGVLPAVGDALAEIAAGLTGADLSSLLSEAGSPLSSQAVDDILGDVAGLEDLPSDATVPASLLSGISQGLDTVASAPGVPAAASSALEDVASTLGSASGVTPSTLSSVLPTLADTVPSLDSVPVTGPALGSLVGGLTDSLASSPPASGGAGGVGGLGGSGGSGSGQQAGPTYITYMQAASASTSIGASITSVKWEKNKLHVVLSCPKALTGGCHTAINLSFGGWKTTAKKVTITAGKKYNATVGLPHLATVAAKQGRAITVTATTGSYTTHNHTIHIKFKH